MICFNIFSLLKYVQFSIYFDEDTADVIILTVGITYFLQNSPLNSPKLLVSTVSAHCSDEVDGERHMCRRIGLQGPTVGNFRSTVPTYWGYYLLWNIIHTSTNTTFSRGSVLNFEVFRIFDSSGNIVQNIFDLQITSITRTFLFSFNKQNRPSNLEYII